MPEQKQKIDKYSQAGLPDFTILEKKPIKERWHWKTDGAHALKRVLKIGAVFALVFGIYSHYFLYLDFTYGCEITLDPSFLNWNDLAIKRALTDIKQISPDQYFRVCQRIKNIGTNLACGGLDGGCFSDFDRQSKKPDERTKRKSIDIAAYDENYSVDMIVHETCHAYQYYENRPFDENECYALGDSIYEKYTGKKIQR